ncbi:Ger(x)C family spore germination protein [Paenibacillus sp. IITD108]|uniref:Ger(x)C family spore germination protein n=1 Tax=Paenibacillus sp. IITD108 TaxID=3116649 RepID=UPI002F40C976
MRKKRLLLLFLNLFILLSLTSCWNSKDIQNMAYVTAIGFDYADNQYTTYVQVLNFSNVAKGEANAMGKNVPNWIGKGTGTTVTESFNSIYATSQLRLFWGHVKAIVLSERFLKDIDQVAETYDMVNRYREIRYNILLYGTTESMIDIFSQKSNLNITPIESLLAQPSQIYSQRSYILPVYGYKLIASLNEPSGLGILPALSIDHNNWFEDKKGTSMFRINGAYFYNEKKYSGYMTAKQLEGFRWMQHKLERSPINIPDDKDPAAAIVLQKPKTKIHHYEKDGKVNFDIKISLLAYVDELIRNETKENIEKQAGEVIANQIRASFEKGVEIKADVLELGSRLYRMDNTLWEKQHSKNTFFLTKESLRNVEVKVTLIHSGKYKLKVE